MIRARYSTVLLVLAALVACPLLSPAQHHHRPPGEIPQKAIDVYTYALAHHAPPAGYVGGRAWQNREKNLPRGGTYHEFDVNPKIRGHNRGPERVIIDYDTGKGWFTGDHYRTFVLIPRGP
jgi:ribonuclease T1